MTQQSDLSRIKVYFGAMRPKFLTASAAPVLVGSALAYATAGIFEPLLFVLALLAIMALHAGANITNDYFDHLSGNDWVNRNCTAFSGGSRFIQKGVLSPKQTLTAALAFLGAASAIGVVIVLWTGSLFILILGLIGMLGGYFYTALPVRLGYRCVGEIVIGLLFGVLPVFGSYYLQTKSLDATALLPGCLVGILIFLVILINEFPDTAADAAVNKRTLTVNLGVRVCIRVYRITLVAGYIIAFAATLVLPYMRFAGTLFLLTIPIAVFAITVANEKNLTTPGHSLANKITIILHSTGAVALTVGFVIYGLCSTTR